LSHALFPPAQISTFQLLSIAGEGGMAAVFRARDSRLGRDAIKVLLRRGGRSPAAGPTASGSSSIVLSLKPIRR